MSTPGLEDPPDGIFLDTHSLHTDDTDAMFDTFLAKLRHEAEVMGHLSEGMSPFPF